MASYVLPDYLKDRLNLVFVGFNPSLRSAELGHYYAGRGNQFWPFLFEVGLTDRRLMAEEDYRILGYGIGLTDIVKGRATRGIGDLKNGEYVDGFDVLREKIRKYRPRVVCFNGKSGYGKVTGKTCGYGLQDARFEGAMLFLAPSSSGALPMKRAEKLGHYRNLKQIVDRRSEEEG